MCSVFLSIILVQGPRWRPQGVLQQAHWQCIKDSKTRMDDREGLLKARYEVGLWTSRTNLTCGIRDTKRIASGPVEEDTD